MAVSRSAGSRTGPSAPRSRPPYSAGASPTTWWANRQGRLAALELTDALGEPLLLSQELFALLLSVPRPLPSAAGRLQEAQALEAQALEGVGRSLRRAIQGHVRLCAA